jgi:hypothetical protein
MRTPSRMVAIAVLVLSVVGLTTASAAAGGPPPPPPPPTPFTCTGTLMAPEAIPPATYTTLTMPAGSICELPGPQPTTVLSGITLQNGSGLVTGVTRNASTLKIVGGVTLQPDSLFVADLKTEKHPVNILGPVTVGWATRSRGSRPSPPSRVGCRPRTPRPW